MGSGEAMIELHCFPGNASMVPHIVLEELGVPFTLKLVDRTANAHKAADYLRMNPNGLIPVLVDGDLVLYETAAICLHLVDSHPGAGLAPALGTRERAHFYKWLVWMTRSPSCCAAGRADSHGRHAASPISGLTWNACWLGRRWAGCSPPRTWRRRMSDH